MATITDSAWIAGPVAVAALLTALLIIWRKALRPVAVGFRKIVGMADTLGEIATEFRPNHGDSLKDQLGRINEKLDAAAAQALTAVSRAEAAARAAGEAATIAASSNIAVLETRDLVEAHIESDDRTFSEIKEGNVAKATLLAALEAGQAALMLQVTEHEATEMAAIAKTTAAVEQLAQSQPTTTTTTTTTTEPTGPTGPTEPPSRVRP